MVQPVADDSGTISGRWLTAHSSEVQMSSGPLDLITDICSWNTFLMPSTGLVSQGQIPHTALCVLQHVLFICFQQTNPRGGCCCPGLPRPHTQHTSTLTVFLQRITSEYALCYTMSCLLSFYCVLPGYIFFKLNVIFQGYSTQFWLHFFELFSLQLPGN